jgi:Fe2+ or Zn2+ uptake regulation protein
MTKPLATMEAYPDAPRSDHILHVLHDAGLRSTGQRIVLTSLLIRHPPHRVSADSLYDRAQRSQLPVSRATVGNTLRAFERAGFLRRIPDRRSRKAWFALDQRILCLK